MIGTIASATPMIDAAFAACRNRRRTSHEVRIRRSIGGSTLTAGMVPQ
jgi:hypothetical protein